VLNLSFHSKDSITIRLPVFNLVDPESIVTWIELRHLILEAGSRFQIRIQIYSAFFIIIIWYGLDLFLFATAIKIVNIFWFEWSFWIVVAANAIVLNSGLYFIMKPLS
jgi:hypothetical protein